MDHLRFAVCIIFPGATALDIANAAIKHNVHILDREFFDPVKDYSDIGYNLPDNGATIAPLFLFSGDNSILAESPENLASAVIIIRTLGSRI